MMSDKMATSFEIPLELEKKIDERIRMGGFRTKSEYIRFLIREDLKKHNLLENE